MTREEIVKTLTYWSGKGRSPWYAEEYAQVIALVGEAAEAGDKTAARLTKYIKAGTRGCKVREQEAGVIADAIIKAREATAQADVAATSVADEPATVNEPDANAETPATSSAVRVKAYFAKKSNGNYTRTFEFDTKGGIYKLANLFNRRVHREMIVSLNDGTDSELFRVKVYRGRLCVDNGFGVMPIDRRSNIYRQLAEHEHGLQFIDAPANIFE